MTLDVDPPSATSLVEDYRCVPLSQVSVQLKTGLGLDAHSRALPPDMLSDLGGSICVLVFAVNPWNHVCKPRLHFSLFWTLHGLGETQYC